jgi:hypothetical protein
MNTDQNIEGWGVNAPAVFSKIVASRHLDPA